MVKNLPAVQETWVQSLGQEDALEEGMATHSSILPWKISRMEEPCGLQFMGSQRVSQTQLRLMLFYGERLRSWTSTYLCKRNDNSLCFLYNCSGDDVLRQFVT